MWVSRFFYQPGVWAAQIYESFFRWGQGVGLSPFWIRFIDVIVVAIILISFIFIDVMFLTWMERKVAGYIQSRYGPMRTGFRGILQPVADGIKLLCKEPMALPGVDKFIYFVSPLMLFVAAMMVFIVIPFAPGWVVAPLEYGLIFAFAASGVSSFFVMAGGWSSNNKWSLLGGMRAVAQILAYEVPLIIAALSVTLFAGSFNLVTIVEDQAGLWNLVRQPVAFLLFLVAGLAEINRAPFDMAEAEQELVAGYLTEFSGMRFAMYYVGEYTHLLANACVVTSLFLGGWQGPLLPPVIWFLLKVHVVIFFYMWVRWTYPRVRVDQLSIFSWKFLLPLSLINLGVTGFALVL